MKLAMAEWRGPVPGMRPGGLEHPAWGLILHIMGGSMSAADGWFHNPQSQVSAHFGIANDGHLVQWVDTDDRAWAEGAGNPNYYSVETEGSGGPLTDAQVKTCALLYAELAKLDGFPFALAETPGEHGFGWHGMGGTAWGGHPYCPGPERKAQRQRILDLAQGHSPTSGDDMTPDQAKQLDECHAALSLLMQAFINTKVGVPGEPEQNAEWLIKNQLSKIPAIKAKVGA